MDILDAYASAAPSAQAVIDIFRGEWSSKLPEDSGLIATPGGAALFDDQRIKWLSRLIGGFERKRVLELGPLEAGHTYMMHEGGAKEIVSVEANSRSYLKCLCIKEVFSLDRAAFLRGDALEFLATSEDRFDLAVASGILYHTTRPLELLRGLVRTSDTLFLWTHYYDQEALRRLGVPFKQFGHPQQIDFEGRSYTAASRSYGKATDWAGFCGGPQASALWLTRESLFGAIEYFGYTVQEIGFDTRVHPNGPALALVAVRNHAAK